MFGKKQLPTIQQLISIDLQHFFLGMLLHRCRIDLTKSKVCFSCSFSWTFTTFCSRAIATECEVWDYRDEHEWHPFPARLHPNSKGWYFPWRRGLRSRADQRRRIQGRLWLDSFGLWVALEEYQDHHHCSVLISTWIWQWCWVIPPSYSEEPCCA